jgi:5-methyltetrahydrofolate--homocysteine methyltransferase
MGSMIQTFKLSEADFRGEQFKSHGYDLKGNNDLLCLTRPDVIEKIHSDYFAAGADMVETNTFSSTSIGQSDYHLEAAVREINLAAIGCARQAAKRAEAATPGRRCFVAGAIGPLNRTLSLSPDVNRPDYRAVTWDQVVGAYTEQINALLDGGVDALLVETIFDTLNAKAALFAIENVFDQRGASARVPVMISVTITDASGRTLSGQTISAFYQSVAHARPFSVGINCALGGRAMRPYVEELSKIAECYTTCYPNAGLPNAFGGYDETPADMASVLAEFADNGWVNMVGGCCGSTPPHIAAIAKAVAGKKPRTIAKHTPALRLSGLEPLTAA